MTRLRRNLIALAVCILSVAGLGASLVAVPLIDDLSSEPTVTVIPANESVEIGDWTFTLTNSGEFPGEGRDENSIPVGDALIAAVIMIEPGPGVGADEGIGCDAELVEPGTERQWTQLVSEREFGYGLLEDSDTLCYLEAEPRQLEVVYLTPDGVYDDVAIDVTVSGDFDKVFRFELIR